MREIRNSGIHLLGFLSIDEAGFVGGDLRGRPNRNPSLHVTDLPSVKIDNIEFRDHWSWLGACSSWGVFPPPAFVMSSELPGEREWLKDHLTQMNYTVPEDLSGFYNVSASGNSNGEIFDAYMRKVDPCASCPRAHELTWSQVILPWAKAQLASKGPNSGIVIAVDGHRSHVIEPSLVLEFREANIFLLMLPAHCTGVLQLCDVWLFGGIKVMFRAESSVMGAGFNRDHCIGTFFDVSICACRRCFNSDCTTTVRTHDGRCSESSRARTTAPSS